MEGIIFYIVVIAVFLFVRAGKKKGGAKKAGNSADQRVTFSTSTSTKRTNLNGKTTRTTVRDLAHEAEHKMKEYQYRTTHEDQGYDERMLDYCDSELSDTVGISFKDLPEGSDELIYLRRYNHQREKELEKALQSAD